MGMNYRGRYSTHQLFYIRLLGLSADLPQQDTSIFMLRNRYVLADKRKYNHIKLFSNHLIDNILDIDLPTTISGKEVPRCNLNYSHIYKNEL